MLGRSGKFLSFSESFSVTADEGESVKYPYPHRTISEMDAEAAVNRFHTKRLAKTAGFFISLTPPQQRTQERIDHACDFIQRDMPLGQITITA